MPEIVEVKKYADFINELIKKEHLKNYFNYLFIQASNYINKN